MGFPWSGETTGWCSAMSVPRSPVGGGEGEGQADSGPCRYLRSEEDYCLEKSVLFNLGTTRPFRMTITSHSLELKYKHTPKAT